MATGKDKVTQGHRVILANGIVSAKEMKDTEIKQTKDNANRGIRSGRNRGGQSQNQNAIKKSVYSKLTRFSDHFPGYTTALAKADAGEEVALTRAMLANVLVGKMPLGEGEILDTEYQAEIARDIIVINLKAQEIYQRQLTKREEMALKRKEKDKGVTVSFTTDFSDAVNGKVEDVPDTANEDADMILANVKTALEESHKARGDE